MVWEGFQPCQKIPQHQQGTGVCLKFQIKEHNTFILQFKQQLLCTLLLVLGICFFKQYTKDKNAETYIHTKRKKCIKGKPVYQNLEALNSILKQCTSYDSLHRGALLERGTFFRLQVYRRVGISLVEV